MNSKFRFFKHRDILSGDVLSMRFLVSIPDEREFNGKLWMFLQETRSELEAETKKAVLQTLGPEFEVRDISFKRGSIEILLVIGTVYYAISRYKNFVESIEMLVSQLRRIFSRFFERWGPMPVHVSGNWTPGPAMVRIETMMSYRPIDVNTILLWYVLLSHAVLLGVFIWLLLHR
ncbi:MAG: hypothetical protein NWE98_11070 [Candidatus Bathyarchaeota archaeon]|nr:hypothetical protein [Candidatus Bathyarchaeota archaeon]